jgi:hypothetical protein
MGVHVLEDPSKQYRNYAQPALSEQVSYTQKKKTPHLAFDEIGGKKRTNLICLRAMRDSR